MQINEKQKKYASLFSKDIPCWIPQTLNQKMIKEIANLKIEAQRFENGPTKYDGTE